jgi:hypothetical protein
MNQLGFPIDQAAEKGEIWIDLPTDQSLEGVYGGLLNRIVDKALEWELCADKDFHKDRKVLDQILAEEEPTPLYVQTVITACKKGDEYKAWSVDCGIAQINTRGQICPKELLTLEGNMKALEKIYKEQGLNAWVSYKTGAYKRYL